MNILNHFAIIPDGNRRWARERGLPSYMGHYYGVKKAEEILDWWLSTNIKELSFYTLSYENFLSRSKIELNFLFKLLDKYLTDIIKGKNEIFNKIIKNGVRIKFVGLLEKLPKKLYDKVKKVMEMTKDNSKKIMNFLLIYSGRLEILNAIKNIKNLDKLDEEEFRNNLWVKNDVDLIIRTGGFSRLSNLLIYQSAYAEIYIINKYWPDVTIEDMEKAIEWFKNVKRNFGH